MKVKAKVNRLFVKSEIRSESEMKLLVGLGNPGREYEKSRHNVGFMFADAFAKAHSCGFSFKSKFNAEIAETVLNGEKCLVCKPQTFMNLSGHAVSAVMNFYKIEPKDLLVVFDDMSFKVGKMRFRAKGSDGGHNGIKSIIACTGSLDFPRLKIGIGSPVYKSAVVDFVLGDFNKDDSEVISDIVEVAVDAAEEFFKNGINFVQNKYN